MDSNKDKSKMHMPDGQPPLPPELDWERMEAGILKKMDDLESGKAPRRPGNFKKIAAAVVLLAILILLVKYCTQTKVGFALENAVATQKQPAEAPAGPEMQHPPIIAETPSSGSDGNPATPPTARDTGRGAGKNGPSSISPSPETADKSTRDANATNGTNPPNRHAGSSEAKVGQPKQALTTGAENTDAENAGLAPKGTISTSVEQAKPPFEAPVESQSPVSAEALPFRTFFVEGEKARPGLLEIPVAEPEKSPTRKGKGRIFLLGGATAWGMGYGSNKPERHDFENATVSFHTGFSYVHTLKNNFTLAIGMQVQQLESRFEWNQDLNDYKVTLMDTVLEVRVNTLTGETEELRGDVELNVPARRMVRHHNTVRLYQIPFAVGKTWASKKWQTDVMLGGAITVFSKNNGRTLHEDELLDYDGTSTSFLSTQGKLHALLAGRLTYAITKNMGITTGIQFQQSLSNWSREQNIRMRPNLLNLELGLRYSL
ncbi:MAG: hypothetical protein R2830_18760 [Saprospiraceae bacterium]